MKKKLDDDFTKVTAMRKGGEKLSHIKQDLEDFVSPGVSFSQIEDKAQQLIKKMGCLPSFSTVPGYSWATCVMTNQDLCHGIPQGGVVKESDIVTIDVGLIQDGFHLDTSITFPVGKITKKQEYFLEVGRKSLRKAIAKAKLGNTVYDISRAMEKVVVQAGFSPVYQLTGHGIGRQLHQDPSIPCIASKKDKRHVLSLNQTIAIEIMYAQGDSDLKLSQDGWTYTTRDGSLTGMFEETVLITENGPEILTKVT